MCIQFKFFSLRNLIAKFPKYLSVSWSMHRPSLQFSHDPHHKLSISRFKNRNHVTLVHSSFVPLGKKGHFLTNQFSTTCCLQLCFNYIIIFIFKNYMWMWWHLKWINMLTSLVNVRHWPLTGVDCQKKELNKI